ncbi:hypothetical protein POM88_036355 [Heracleum sosnowskyi]|uniref:MYB-CC type transcription factor LHEQLE-containing domain-containing protein n=2 Tax=Heracleum sosnowskyi TaxID=360622 RepID=A0AAD8MFJ7_9APIA|nr:hypothetical protein POM88_036355 [Heracleum sosnowskyi]
MVFENYAQIMILDLLVQLPALKELMFRLLDCQLCKRVACQNEKVPKRVVHFVTFYAPLWGAIIFNGITYFQVIRMLNNAARVCKLNLFSISPILGLEYFSFQMWRTFCGSAKAAHPQLSDIEFSDGRRREVVSEAKEVGYTKPNPRDDLAGTDVARKVQRHLQLRIEAQGKYLQTVLEKAQDTLGKQNLGTVGLEAAKVQLSELVSKVSTKSLNSAFSGMTEVPSFCPQQIQAKQPTDCSMQSFLTSYEVSQQGQEIQNRWSKDLKDNRNFISPMVQDTDKAYEMQLHASDLSMRVGVQGGNWNSNSTDVQEKMKDRDLDANLFYPSTHSVKQEDVKSRQGFQISRSAPKLDLNIHDDSDTCCISLGSEAPPSFDSSCFE